MSGSVVDLRWAMAERAVEQAGYEHRRAGECLWCWPAGATDHHGRYVDIAGLLAADDPVAYAISCLEVGGRRPDAPFSCVEEGARPFLRIERGTLQEVPRQKRPQSPNLTGV